MCQGRERLVAQRLSALARCKALLAATPTFPRRLFLGQKGGRPTGLLFVTRTQADAPRTPLKGELIGLLGHMLAYFLPWEAETGCEAGLAFPSHLLYRRRRFLSPPPPFPSPKSHSGGLRSSGSGSRRVIWAARRPQDPSEWCGKGNLGGGGGEWRGEQCEGGVVEGD